MNMTRSSRSNVLYDICALSSFREKKASGFQLSSRNCSRTPPIAKSDASTVMQVVAVALGWLSRVAEASHVLLHQTLTDVGQSSESPDPLRETSHVKDP